MIHQGKCNTAKPDSINLLKVDSALVSSILSHFQNPKGPNVNTFNSFASSKSTCQYLNLRFTVENQIPPCKLPNASSILGNTYQSLMVLLFSLHRKMQNQNSQSFFLTNTTALVHELKLCLIAPFSTIS